MVYAGGWSDYQAQRREMGVDGQKSDGKASRSAKARASESAQKPNLSFTEQHRLEALPGELARLEAEIAKLEGLLADADLFTASR